jgi:hypothetical protein
MPIKGSTIFIRFPNESNNRILHPVDVTETSGSDNLTVLPENPDLALEAEQEVLIYFEKKRKFMQQPARVEALLEGEQGNVAILKTLGEPVSAESRQCYRVSTVLSKLTTTFDGVEGCSLRDVSVTGFAVISSKKYKTGQIIDAELRFEGKRYTGKTSVQSVTEMPEGQFRYGVNCVKTAASPQSLSKGVQQISMSVQRQQLNRLAGGA